MGRDVTNFTAWQGHRGGMGPCAVTCFQPHLRELDAMGTPASFWQASQQAVSHSSFPQVCGLLSPLLR